MTREKIIELAKEAGALLYGRGPRGSLVANGDSLETFANLVTAEQQKRIEGLERKIEFWRDKAKDQTQLAAAQAQIKVLRDALERFALIDLGRETVPSDFAFNVLKARKALTQPTDDSALRELLKAERERCAKVADAWDHDKRIAAAIRAMEDQ